MHLTLINVTLAIHSYSKIPILGDATCLGYETKRG